MTEKAADRAPHAGEPAAIEWIAAGIRWWALGGGIILAILALLSTASAVSNLISARPFAFEHEIVKHFVGVAIFMFLPYCQLTGANVTVDIFTERAGPLAKAAMAFFSSLFAIAFSILLLRQMSLGLQGYLRFVEVTPVLKLPLWTAFPPILLSLLLLLVAAVITALDGFRTMRGHPALLPGAPQPPMD